MKEEIIVYADGSSLGNPGRGGYGVVILDGDHILELGGGDKHTTNNRMELTAAIEALSHIKKGRRVILRTDSSYLINGFTKWLPKWKENKWKTSTKKNVENKDLWVKLARATIGKEISWEHIGNC